jgi:hypothetical protein
LKQWQQWEWAYLQDQLLTLIWGSVVTFGSYDLSQPSAADSSDVENKTPFSLTGFFLTLVNCIN